MRRIGFSADSISDDGSYVGTDGDAVDVDAADGVVDGAFESAQHDQLKRVFFVQSWFFRLYSLLFENSLILFSENHWFVTFQHMRLKRMDSDETGQSINNNSHLKS